MNIKSEKGGNDMNNRRLDRDDLMKKFDTLGLIKYLNDIVDCEIEKTDKMDTDMIDECVDWIRELKGVEKLTEEEVKSRVRSIITKQHIPKKRKFRFLYVAAIIIVMIFSTQIISVTAFSFDFFVWTKDTFLALIGIEMHQDDTTYKSSRIKKYNTVEELEETENIDIIVPTWLPDDVKIDSVTYAYDFEHKQIQLDYNGNTTSLFINLDSLLPNTDGTEIYKNNNILFYVFEEANLIFWEYDENFYSLNCGFDISEYVEKIIENIK